MSQYIIMLPDGRKYSLVTALADSFINGNQAAAQHEFQEMIQFVGSAEQGPSIHQGSSNLRVARKSNHKKPESQIEADVLSHEAEGRVYAHESDRRRRPHVAVPSLDLTRINPGPDLRKTKKPIIIDKVVGVDKAHGDGHVNGQNQMTMPAGVLAGNLREARNPEEPKPRIPAALSSHEAWRPDPLVSGYVRGWGLGSDATKEVSGAGKTGPGGHVNGEATRTTGKPRATRNFLQRQQEDMKRRNSRYTNNGIAGAKDIKNKKKAQKGKEDRKKR